MPPAHIHAGVLDFVVIALFYLILAFLLRQVQTRWPDSPFGKALAYLHG